MTIGIRGYTNRPNVAPGDTVSFHVSCDEEGDFDAALMRIVQGEPNPEGPGVKEHAIDSPVNGRYAAAKHRTQLGGYVEITDDDAALSGQDGFTLHAFVAAMTPAQPGIQTIMSRWDTSTSTGWRLYVEEGRLAIDVGPGGRGAVVRLAVDEALFSDTWYSVVASYEPAAGVLRIAHKAVVNSTNGRFGRVVPIVESADAEGAAPTAPGLAQVPVLIGGSAEGPPVEERTWVVALFNGKIDSPKVYAGALRDDDIARLHQGDATATPPSAHWDFAANATKSGVPSDAVEDLVGAHPGRCCNQPDRGMTGWNWEGRHEHFAHAPEQYGAIWLHADSLDDARWPASAELRVPDDLKSGCYALRVRQGENEDYIPFFVTAPDGKPAAKVLFLVPTFSYMAYANTQVFQNAESAQAVTGDIGVLEDRDLAVNEHPEYGLSTYDLHSDGRGCQYSTWRRPILNMRPSYRHEFGAVWQYPADLHFTDWLESQQIEYDVATDHDVQERGAAVLSDYNVVVMGTHPEYWSYEMLDAWEQYLCSGGRGMYLAGNGLYWVTSQDPEKPWVIEVRKGESGDQAWRARPGELHHATTGERGGIWRGRGRAPQKLCGIGYVSHTMDHSSSYKQMPDARDSRLSWLFEGIGADEPIGDFGSIYGGASGLEIDHYDLALGTPPHTMLLACSNRHGANARLVPEEQYFAHSGMNAEEHPAVRADMTYFSTANGGAMFSTGSMAWCASLAHNDYDNNVSRLTANVLRRFADDSPLDEVV